MTKLLGTNIILLNNSVLYVGVAGVLIREFMQRAYCRHSASAFTLSKCKPSEVHPSAFISSVNTSILKTPNIIDPPKIKIIDLPFPVIKQIYDVPRASDVKYEDKLPVKEIHDPTSSLNDEKKAARLIVIRRRKMKKHKLKKLRVRMKFEWAKLRQRREMKKEKEFHAELLAKIRAADNFNPEVYAKEKMTKATEIPFPRRWKGKRLPRFVIEDLIAKKNKKAAEIQASKQKRSSMSMKVADYPYIEK